MSKAYNVQKVLSAPAEEAYRVLKTNIQFCSVDKKIKTLAITSCNPGEGKTTTAINLSISMAKSGMKVLLVDGDLRKPMLMKRLGHTSTVGLSNIISGQASLDDTVNYNELEGFYYITCGPKPPNPSELLSSERFSKLLNEVREHFDMVIIDTPPLGSVIDCAVIASQTDGTLIVIEAKAVDYHSAIRVKEQLEKVNARIIGVVLNKLEKRDYKYYYNYYNYYGNKKHKDKRWFRKDKEIDS